MMDENETRTLTQEQNKARIELVAGKPEPLVDLLLDRTGRLLRMFVGRSKSPPYWLSGLAIGLIILITGSFVSLVSREFSSMSLGEILLTLTLILAGVAALLATKLHRNLTLKIINDDLIDVMKSTADLHDLRRWLDLERKVPVQLVFSLIFGTLFGLYDVWASSLANKHFIGVGPALVMIASFTLLGMFYYHVLVMLNFATRVGRYELELFAVDPSRSEVIIRLRRLFNILVYISTVFLVIYTFHAAFFRRFRPGDAFFLFGLGWVVLLLLFTSYNYSLARLIKGSKSKLLFELEVEIKTLQDRKNILNNKTLPRMLELMRFRQFILSTPNSMLDLNAALSLINSIFLPLLAFVLANSTKLIELLGRWPIVD